MEKLEIYDIIPVRMASFLAGPDRGIVGRMRKILAASALLTVMSWTAPALAQQAVPGSPPLAMPPRAADGRPALPDLRPQPCDFSSMVGKAVDEGALKATGRPYRILPPGSMKTMDYAPARIDVETDDKNVVTAVTCG